MRAYNFIQKNGWVLASVLYTILILCFANAPVFWDMYAQVKTAHYYLETNFHHLLPNGNGFTDNGHFPLYALYLAGCFKLFGFHIWVAHFSIVPFVVGLFYQLQHFCKRFLSDKKTLFALLLVLLNPALQVQSIYFNSEICLAFCSVWLLNTLLDERASRIALSSILLCLLNLRALPFIFLLWIYITFFKKKKIAWYLSFSLLVFVIWLMVHFYLYGWLFQNPENIGHRSLAGFMDMLKNMCWFVVHLFDYGNILALIFIALFYFRQKTMKEPLIFLLFFVAGVFAFSIPLSNPINTRYFIPIYILAVPCFLMAITNFSRRKTILILSVYLLCMWQTQLIKTPEKYGYSWDCNWQSVSCFEARKQLDEYVAQNNISPQEIEAGFQLFFNDNFYLMNNSHKEYALLSDTEMPQSKYIAQSNIPNNYNIEREKYIQKNYSLVKTFSKGWVYIDLYKKQ